MIIEEGTFEVKYKDRKNPNNIKLIKNALIDLYSNLEDYEIVNRNKFDQTQVFMNKFSIYKMDILTLIEDYGFSLLLYEYADVLLDRDRNGLLYTFYIPDAKIGNWDSSKTNQKLLYIKWNPINKKILSFHPMKKHHNRSFTNMTENKLDEKLSYNDLIDKVFYTGNDNWHLKKFYDLRKKYNGKDTSNVKLITTSIDDVGYCDILFSVKPTKDGTIKKELTDADDGTMTDNISNEYMVTIRINDFWDMIEEFGLEKYNDFTKKDIVALVQLSEDIKLKSNDPSFWWQGLSYWLTLDDGSLMPCNIAPKFWDKYRPNVKVSKIVESVLRQFGFFTQQIAMSIKRNLIEQGYITK